MCGRVRGGEAVGRHRGAPARRGWGTRKNKTKEKNDPDADRETPIVIHPGGGPPEAMTAAADACAAWQLLRQESDPWGNSRFATVGVDGGGDGDVVERAAD